MGCGSVQALFMSESTYGLEISLGVHELVSYNQVGGQRPTEGDKEIMGQLIYLCEYAQIFLSAFQ